MIIVALFPTNSKQIKKIIFVLFCSFKEVRNHGRFRQSREVRNSSPLLLGNTIQKTIIHKEKESYPGGDTGGKKRGRY